MQLHDLAPRDHYPPTCSCHCIVEEQGCNINSTATALILQPCVAPYLLQQP